ncbi:crossover junction endodeoxyribonuclease RuvC [bacterium]|nr:crossover junction endodeoxyribonuclease RuvC [bacterium]
MIILGIDPGSRITGYGLIEKTPNKSLHVECGVIYCANLQTLPEKLATIYDGVERLILKFKPQALSIETAFYAKNVASTLKLGHARGVVLALAYKMGLQIFEYAPRSIKQTVTGYGGASKEQVQKMVKTLLGLPEIAEENASDALAAALCHAQTNQLVDILKQKLKTPGVNLAKAGVHL